MMASRNKSKKTVSKDELRRLMKRKEAEVKSATRKKVEHPLATYNSLGQLVCSLCNCVVKTDLLWTTHLQNKNHKEKLAAFKSRTQGPQAPEPSLKRKIGGNYSETVVKKGKIKDNGIPDDFFDSSSKMSEATTNEKKAVIGLAAYSSSEESSGEEEETKGHNPALPSDFFDAGASSEKEEEKVSKAMADNLPEGFFDDPKMDAKVRQVEYRDKMEDEWEKFQKVMKEQNTVSEAIVEEEEEQTTVDRNIDEIDEQIQKWQEVNDLQVKKEEIMQKKSESTTQEKNGSNAESDEEIGEDEFNEFLDWRTKKVWK